MKCWCWYHLHNAIEKYASANSPWCFLSKRYNDCQFFQGWNIRAQTKKYFVCINFEMNVCYFLKAIFRTYVVLVLTQLISHDYINVKLKIATHQTANFFSTRDVWLLFANQAGKRHVEHHKNFVHEKLRQVKKKCLFPNYLLQKANKQFCCVTDIIWRTQIYLLRDVENIRHSLVKASWRYQHTNDMESCVGKNCVEFIKYDWKMMWKSLQLGNNTQEMRWKHSYLHLNHSVFENENWQK